MQKIKRQISSILILLFISTMIIPNTAFASTIDNTNNSNNSQVSSGHKAKPPTRVRELVDKRDQHTKYYLNSDGSITAETSVSSRHYKDKNGKWQDISNKIVSSNEPGFNLSNEANSFGTHFAKNSSAKYLAMLKLDSNRKISWNLENANSVAAVNDTNSVTYPDILTSADLQYEPYSDGLKENIILKNSSAPNSFKFDLKADGLLPVLQDDGTIALKDKKSGSLVLVIPKPYMIDSNNIKSDNVTMQLDQSQSQDSYIITVTADSSWLTDPSRAYPITIDPDISTNNLPIPIANTGIDTYIASGAPNTQYYSNTYMTSGYDSSLGYTSALIKFGLGSIPSNAIITDAVLSLYKYTTTSAPTETLLARRVTSSWPYTVPGHQWIPAILKRKLVKLI